VPRGLHARLCHAFLVSTDVNVKSACKMHAHQINFHLNIKIENEVNLLCEVVKCCYAGWVVTLGGSFDGGGGPVT